jgi:ABC-type lipoprotein export system ATPase subunit
VLITHERDIAARAERTIQLHDGRVWDRLTGGRGRGGVDLMEPTR